MATYYHNPKCSKSRQGLEILNNAGISFTIKEYLKEKLDQAEITNLLNSLNLEAKDIVRTKEAIIRDANIDLSNISSNDLINYIIKYPILLERPIFINDNGAVIGRPPENINLLI